MKTKLILSMLAFASLAAFTSHAQEQSTDKMAQSILGPNTPQPNYAPRALGAHALIDKNSKVRLNVYNGVLHVYPDATHDLTFPLSSGALATSGTTSTWVFEGATADAYETTLYAVDPTADGTIYLPDLGAGLADGNVSLFVSTINSGLNAPGLADAVWAGPSSIVFEGATADAYETTIAAADPTVGDATATVPDMAGVSDTFALLTKAQTFGGAKTFTAAIVPTGGVAASGGFTVSPRSINTGGIPAITAADGNNSTPSTTETYCSEIFVPANCTITGIALFNGSDVTGNVTVGLADSTGAPIAAAKSASTAGSGTDAYQRIPFAVAYAAKGPATYYIQVQYDSATARYNTFTVGNHGVQKQTTQTYGTFTSFTPSGTFVTNIGNIAGCY